MKKISFVVLAAICCTDIAFGQVKKPTPTPASDSLIIPVTKADPGTFPYVKTLPNFRATDSSTFEHSLAYFWDGKKYREIEGKISTQNLNIDDSKVNIASEFECIQQFDKLVAALGGIRIFKGKLPEDKLKSLAGADMVELGSKGQVAPSAYYGVVEYVIKTPEKEVWIQLQPFSLASKFYTLLVAEKKIVMLSINTNKHNDVLEALEAGKTATLHLSFLPDEATLQSESKDEILSIVGAYQAHPTWKLAIDVFTAPVGSPEYDKTLTGKRAAQITGELQQLGINVSQITATGRGDEKPLVPNDSEKARAMNTRVEVKKTN